MSRKEITPAQFCEEESQKFIAITKVEQRKEQGQFFTPLEVARFMGRLTPVATESLRVLDPGAGTGILACAVCEYGARRKVIKEIHIDAYENDVRLAESLYRTMEYTKKWMDGRDTELTYNIFTEDFILACSEALWNNELPPYDLAISNPPYLKISKGDPRAQANLELVWGQPNIYALFMGVTARQLKDGGVMVFITPRSYAAGPYFRAFRRHFFRVMNPERVHIFESRKDAFRTAGVLQENIILKARKAGRARRIGISTSEGAGDISRNRVFKIPISDALFKIENDLIFRLPINEDESRILDMVDNWPGNLHEYGMEISTGPVVPFRAEELIPIERKGYKNAVPLLWMQNVRPMRMQWPLEGNNNGKEKRQFIKDNAKSRKKKLLVDNNNMVLLRRFSAKEEARRMVAAPLLQGQLPSRLIGIENHLNYIYRLQGSLSELETLGLSALLNSSLLDRYFRISNGNTQVSATELRAMPLPPLEILVKLGDEISRFNGVPTLEEIDNIVEETLEAEEEMAVAL